METESSDIREFAEFIWRNALVVVLLAALGAIGGITISVLADKVYRSEAVVALVGTQTDPLGVGKLFGQSAGLSGLVGLDMTGQDSLHAIALLESRAFTEQFIERHQLLPILYSDKWDPNDRQWSVEQSEIPTTREARKLFDRSIRRVEEDPTNGLAYITVDWHDPELAAEWANQLIVDLNDKLRREALDEAQRTIDYLTNDGLPIDVVGVREAVYALLEQEIRRKTFANLRRDFALKVIDPALPAEEDDPLYPRPILVATTGAMLGVVFGIGVLVVRRRISSWKKLDA